MTLYHPQTQNKLIRGLNKVDYSLCDGLLQTITQGASYLLDAQFSLCILSINTSSRHDLIDVVTLWALSGDFKNNVKSQRIECKRAGIELVRLSGVGWLKSWVQGDIQRRAKQTIIKPNRNLFNI